MNTLDNNSFDYATGINDYATSNDGYDYNDGWYDNNDDNNSYTYCSSNKDNYYNNTPNVIFDMHGHQFTIDDNDNMVPYDDKQPLTLQATQRQINAILALPDAPLLVLSSNLPTKPNANTMSSFSPRRPIVLYS